MSYSAWCVVCPAWWERHESLEAARAAQADHYASVHPGVEIPGKLPPRDSGRRKVRMSSVTTETTTEPGTEEETGVAEEDATRRLQLALPGMDDVGNDWVELSFTGTIHLDRNDLGDCALIRRLTLGKDVDLDIAGMVVGRGQVAKFDDEGNREVTLGTKVKVTGLRREEPFS